MRSFPRFGEEVCPPNYDKKIEMPSNLSDMMNIAVHPDYRRRGLAGQLVEQLCAELKAGGNTCLTLEVRASNLPAISLYEKLGFTQVGLRKNYYRNPREDALILRKEWEI